MVEWVHAGRPLRQLSREFNGSVQAIRNWVAQHAADAGKPPSGRDVLSSAEREELAPLRRENRRLQMACPGAA